MPRDPDIGTDQECFVCDGSGVIAAHEAKAAPAVPQGEPVAFAWRAKKGQPSAWQVCFDLKQAADAEVLAKTEIRFMSWTTPAAPSQPSKYGSPELQALIVAHATQSQPVTLTLTNDVLEPVVKAIWDSGFAACRDTEIVGTHAQELAWGCVAANVIDKAERAIIAALREKQAKATP